MGGRGRRPPAKRLLCHVTDPVDRLSPRGLIVSVFTNLGPQQLGASLGDLRWHGVLNLDETVRDELPGQEICHVLNLMRGHCQRNWFFNPTMIAKAE